MTTDITERLRERSWCFQPGSSDRALVIEAADKITALTAALESERLAHEATRKELAESIDMLIKAVAKEVIMNGAGCTGEYVKAERCAREIWEKHNG